MAMSHVNFVSYNSTGLNEVKIKWIRDLCFATSSSFVGIQEHFRKIRILTKFLLVDFLNIIAMLCQDTEIVDRTVVDLREV